MPRARLEMMSDDVPRPDEGEVRLAMDERGPPGRPPCCCGIYRDRWGFWTPSVLPGRVCLSYTIPAAVMTLAWANAVGKDVTCDNRWLTLAFVASAVSFVTWPLALLAGLVGLAVDLAVLLAFLLSGCGCCCRRAACRTHGEPCLWYSCGLDEHPSGIRAAPLRYRCRNGRTATATAFRVDLPLGARFERGPDPFAAGDAEAIPEL